MAIATSYFSADLGQMITDLPASCVYSAMTINVSISDISRQETLTMTGQIEAADLRVEFLFSDLTGLPELRPDSRISIRRPSESVYTKYKVVSVIKPPDGVGISAICASDKRNTVTA